MWSVFLFALIGTAIVAGLALLAVGLINIWIWFMDKMLDYDGAKQFCSVMLIVFISLFAFGSVFGSVAYLAKCHTDTLEQKNAVNSSCELEER